jgi:hypothetical protein
MSEQDKYGGPLPMSGTPMTGPLHVPEWGDPLTGPLGKVWGVISVPTGRSGRGDLAAQSLRRVLDAGWEPFAVAEGHIWLKKCSDETTA